MILPFMPGTAPSAVATNPGAKDERMNGRPKSVAVVCVCVRRPPHLLSGLHRPCSLLPSPAPPSSQLSSSCRLPAYLFLTSAAQVKLSPDHPPPTTHHTLPPLPCLALPP